MKRIIIALSAFLVISNTFAFTPEIKSIPLNDGVVIEARLCLPENEVNTVVFCIADTGPTTYLTKRPTFNYFDELATGFCNEQMAFFSYNRRGCQTGETPPLFVDVDSAAYAKYTPLQEAEDVEAMIAFLRNDKRLKKHFELEPNKTRLLRINLPIHIFYGTNDASVPVESVYDLQTRFEVCNKTNLTIHVFEKHDHDLNFTDWLTQNKWSDGFSKLLSVAKDM